MKINIDRMAKLAGLGNSSSRKSRSLNESMDHDAMEEMEEMEDMHETEDMEEMIEIDEVMLVQELRRAKKIMLESKRRSTKQDLKEAKLKKIIEEEVQNMFGEMNLNADWVYGNKKPKRSKKGYTHQGSFLKGIGFE